MDVNKIIHCSLCSKPLDLFDIQNNINIHKQIGYGSIYDGYFLDIDLCSDCLDAVIHTISVEFPLSHRLIREIPNETVSN